MIGICNRCRTRPQETVATILSRIRLAESRMQTAHQVCASCTAIAPVETVRCESLDCQFFFERKKREAKVEELADVMRHFLEETGGDAIPCQDPDE